VTQGALRALGSELRRLSRGVVDAWEEILTNEAELARTLGGLTGAEAFSANQIAQVREWCVRQARIRAERERDGELPSLDAEDDALLLRLWQGMRGPILDADGKPVRYSHVFVDEVQDASPVALRVLIELAGRDRSVTLAGDVAQRMVEEGDERSEVDWHALLRDLGGSASELEPLRVSYRSTAEITSFARGVLGPLAHDAEPVADRHGPPVELFEFTSTGEAVAFLADALRQLHGDEPLSHVALVARFPAQADAYYEGLVLAEISGIRRVRKQDFTWDPGVDVTDVRQTKGLEFDEVVLVDTNASSYPGSSPARHALYVGATRAAHQLWCIASEAPSTLVQDGLAAQTRAASAGGQP
jgi:DNA helicase-2/ATP-dependent DNA helicase PcrA